VVYPPGLVVRRVTEPLSASQGAADAGFSGRSAPANDLSLQEEARSVAGAADQVPSATGGIASARTGGR